MCAWGDNVTCGREIVSWNINSLRKRRSVCSLAARPQRISICLQETKCTDEQFPADALRRAGYHSAFHGQKSYNGRRDSLENRPRDVRPALCDEEEDPQARVIAATIGNVRVFFSYAPNGQAVGSPAYEYKLQSGISDCKGASRS
jgi:exodeoxyribonuclease-3